MRTLGDCSVDSVVCDPPYELGFMGKGWDRSGIAYDVSVWSECLRVLRSGGHLLAFGGSRTYHRLVCAIEDAGFEIRDQIQWIYGSGFPKSLDVSKAIDAAQGLRRERVPNGRAASNHYSTYAQDQWTRENYNTRSEPTPLTEVAQQWNGWGTALKPAHEPIVLARKPLIGTVAENVLQHGTGGLNIDGCRVDGAKGNGNWRGACEQRPEDVYEGGWSEQRTEQNELGRWPANVIHDGSDEVLAGFPVTQTGDGCIKRESGSDRYGHQGYAYGKESRPAGTESPSYGDFGNAARYFYCAKATQEDRNEGCEDLPLRVSDETHKRPRTELDDPRRAGVTPRRNNHPTVKPTDLMRYLCRLVTPPGGTVLDPFCGSGSTGKAAMLEGLKFIGIELSADYCELAQRRIEAVTKQGLLFATA